MLPSTCVTNASPIFRKLCSARSCLTFWLAKRNDPTQEESIAKPRPTTNLYEFDPEASRRAEQRSIEWTRAA